MVDGQLVEIAGRNWLVSQLVQAGFEVARPERDHGVDLIAYLEEPFLACRIQLKASHEAQFTAYEKKFKGMLLVFVWHLNDSTKTVAYALTFKEAQRIAEEKNWVRTPAWKKYGYFRVRNPGKELCEKLDQYKMTTEKWKEKISQQKTKYEP